MSRASFFILDSPSLPSGACFPQALEDRLDQLLREPDPLLLKLSQQRRDLDEETTALGLRENAECPPDGQSKALGREARLPVIREETFSPPVQTEPYGRRLSRIELGPQKTKKVRVRFVRLDINPCGALDLRTARASGSSLGYFVINEVGDQHASIERRQEVDLTEQAEMDERASVRDDRHEPSSLASSSSSKSKGVM
jgi:hypothetical protein